MGSKIFVIHPSVIIREGICSLIKNLFDLDARILSGLEELENYMDLKNQKLIFLIDTGVDQNDFLNKAEHYRSSNDVKIILIREPDTPSECEDNCNCCFYTNTSKFDFESLLKPYLENTHEASLKSGAGLTEREVDVVKLVAFGKTNKEIAGELCISIHTVISHRKNITEKLGIKSISGLTVYAILNNLIDAKNIDPESLI